MKDANKIGDAEKDSIDAYEKEMNYEKLLI